MVLRTPVADRSAPGRSGPLPGLGIIVLSGAKKASAAESSWPHDIGSQSGQADQLYRVGAEPDLELGH